MKRLAPALLIPLAVLALFALRLRPGHIFYGGDLVLVFHPTWVFLSERLAGGSVPLWTPRIGCGFPFAADLQAGTFYPPSWLLALLPPGKGILAGQAFHLALAGWGGFLLSRAFGAGRYPALVGAAVFGFGGFPMAHTLSGHLPMVQAWAWTPFVLWSAAQASRGRRGAWPAAGGFLGLQILAGSPHATWLTFLGLLGLCLLFAFRPLAADGGQGFRVPPSASRGIKERAALLLLPPFALVLGLLLAAVQLFPSLELIRQTGRGTLADPVFSAYGSMPVLHLVTLLAPRFFGGGLAAEGKGIEPDWGAQPFLEYAGYLGVVPLVLFLAAPFCARASWARWSLALGAAAFLAALGPHGPLYPLLRAALPGLSHLRCPGRFVLLAQAAAAVAVPLALEGLCRAEGAALRARAWTLASLFAAAALLAAAGRLGGRGLSACLGTAGAANLLLFGASFLHPYPEEPLRLRPQDAAFLRDPARQGGAPDPSRFVSVRTIRGRNVSDLALPLAERFDGFGLHNPLATERYQDFYDLVLRRPPGGRLLVLGFTWETLARARRDLLELANVRFVLSDSYARSAAVSPPPELIRDNGADLSVLRAGSRPRAILFHQARPVPDRAERLAWMASPEFRPFEEVILEEDCPIPLPGGPADGGACRFIRYDETEIEIEVTARAPGLLFLSDLLYPGWEASVDDRPAPILAADHAFRAVPIAAAGIHRVAFRYRAVWVLRGAAVSAAAAAGIALGWLLARRRGDGAPARFAAGDTGPL